MQLSKQQRAAAPGWPAHNVRPSNLCLRWLRTSGLADSTGLLMLLQQGRHCLHLHSGAIVRASSRCTHIKALALSAPDTPGAVLEVTDVLEHGLPAAPPQAAAAAAPPHLQAAGVGHRQGVSSEGLGHWAAAQHHRRQEPPHHDTPQQQQRQRQRLQDYSTTAAGQANSPLPPVAAAAAAGGAGTQEAWHSGGTWVTPASARLPRYQGEYPLYSRSSSSAASASNAPPVPSHPHLTASHALLHQQQLEQGGPGALQGLPPPSRLASKDLTRLIMGVTHWLELHRLAAAYGPRFNIIHTSAAVVQLARLVGPWHQQQQRQQARRLGRAPPTPKDVTLGGGEGRGAAGAGWHREAAASGGWSQQQQWGAQLDTLLSFLLLRTSQLLPQYGPRQLANTLWALGRLAGGGTLGVTSDAASLVTAQFQRRLLAASLGHLGAAVPQQLASLAWGVAQLGWRPYLQWRLRFWKAVVPQLGLFRPGELALLAHAAAAWEVAAPPPAAVAAAAVTGDARSAGGAAAAAAEGAAGGAAAGNQATGATAGGGATAAAAAAAQGHIPAAKWLHPLLDACQAALPALGGQELVMVGTAVTRWGCGVTPQFLAAYLHAARVHLEATAAAAGADGVVETVPQVDGSSSSDADTAAVAVAVAAAAALEVGGASSKPPPAAAGLTVQGVAMLTRHLVQLPALVQPHTRHTSRQQQQQQQVADAGKHEQQLLPAATVAAGVVPGGGISVAAASPSDGGQQAAAAAAAAAAAGAWQQQQQQQGQVCWSRLVLAAALPQLGAFDARGLSTLLWGLARLHHRDNASSSSSSSSMMAGALSSSSSSVLAQPGPSWCLSSTQCEALWECALQLLPQATSQDLALLVWGCSSLVDAGVVPRLPVYLVKAALRASYLRLPSSTATDLACLLIGWSKLQVAPGRRYMAACCSAWVGQLTAGAGPQEQVNVLTAVAALGHRPPPHVLACFCRYSQPLLRQYSPQGLAGTLDALAQLGYCPPAAWQKRFWAAAAQQMAAFSPRDRVQLLYAAAALDLHPPQQWMDRFLVNLRPDLVNLPPKALTGTIWALATLCHRPGMDWMQVFFDRVNMLTAGGSRGLPEVSAGLGSIVLHGVTLWAAQRLGYSLAEGEGKGDHTLAEEGEGLAPATGTSSLLQPTQHQQEVVVAGWQQGQGSTHPAPALDVGRALATAGAGGEGLQAVAAAGAGAGEWGRAGEVGPTHHHHHQQQLLQREVVPERRLPQLVLCTFT